ncbi:hypothetical protein EON65_06875 [archaeon]|nr:MAG: hypothetical protein EON65_06875 [archaeon]
MSQSKIPHVDFEDEEFLETLLPLVEKHKVLCRDKKKTMDVKWELVAEDLYNALDPNMFKPCSTWHLRKVFSQFKRSIESKYSDLIYSEPLTPLDSDQIPDPFHLQIVNMIRQGRGESEEETKELVDASLVSGKNKSKQVRFSTIQGTHAAAGAPAEDEAYFHDLLSSPKDSLLQAVVPPKSNLAIKQYNTQKNAGTKRGGKNSGGAASTKKSKVVLASSFEHDEPEEMPLNNKSLDKLDLTSSHMVNSLIRTQDDPSKIPSIIEKQLELKVQEAKNQGKALDLEIEKMGIEKLRQQIRLQSLLNH